MNLYTRHDKKKKRLDAYLEFFFVNVRTYLSNKVVSSQGNLQIMIRM